MTEKPRPDWIKRRMAQPFPNAYRWGVLAWTAWCWFHVVNNLIGGATSVGTPTFVLNVLAGLFQFICAMVGTAVVMWVWPTAEEKSAMAAKRAQRRSERGTWRSRR